MNFSSKSVFVTGGATGIGEALVRAFHASGALVSFNDIAQDEGRALAAELGPKVHFVYADATDTGSLQASIDEGAKLNGGLDVLVNNVANDLRDNPSQITTDSWRRSMSVNLDPVFFASQRAKPYLSARGGGAIINFSSLNILLGPADLIAYTAAKSAIIGLTKSLATAWGSDRIRVNAIIPGWVVTEKQKKLWLTPELESEWKEQCRIKDDLTPEDVANLTLFLASDQAKMITAQGIVIDGGRV